MKFELHTRYTLTTPNAISDAGVGEIIRFIQSQNLKADPWLSLNPDYAVPFLYPLPDEWEYTWLVQKGEYRGTFPKRVSKYYQMTYGVKCPDSFLAELGQIARRNSGEAAAYEFDFTNRFDWNAGDFGESRYSCFWGNRTGARTMLTENGGLAIRFYRENKGFARAWLVSIEDDQYVIFNGYGFAGNATLTIARLFAQFVGKTYKKIQLVNNGSASRTLYINNSIGYLIALANQLAQTGRYDFQWDEIYEETCYGCGEGLS
ncbi:MAG: hypothetical protein K8I82_02220, partial [Anaerolineae bacterium]|nr:hypothetical protein [Anaerolineae bacterium]